MDLCCIRALRAEEYGRLKEFLYEAIFLPDGAQPLPREVTDDPSLRIYWEGFGREPDDRALCAEARGRSSVQSGAGCCPRGSGMRIGGRRSWLWRFLRLTGRKGSGVD